MGFGGETINHFF